MIAVISLWAVFLLFALRRLLTYLHIYQQDEYSARRFTPWLFRTLAFDRRVSLGLLILAVLPLGIWKIWLASTVLAFAAWRGANPIKLGKKRLV